MVPDRDARGAMGAEAGGVPRDYSETLRIEKLNGYTATQAFVNKLTGNGLRHKVVFADEDPNRVETVIWTYP
ncbi:hypothetical protein G7054_g11747 [Neopestalotiopsis clavispora]|nr:hypothetical protein G7054_g11747 [Neopestalotiopsis clavispora]